MKLFPKLLGRKNSSLGGKRNRARVYQIYEAYNQSRYFDNCDDFFPFSPAPGYGCH